MQILVVGRRSIEQHEERNWAATLSVGRGATNLFFFFEVRSRNRSMPMKSIAEPSINNPLSMASRLFSSSSLFSRETQSALVSLSTVLGLMRNYRVRRHVEIAEFATLFVRGRSQ